MARLFVSLLGPFQATLEGDPVTDFKSNKVRALLAYLAVEADRPHPREVLAGLLWPDWPDREALSNLRYALSDLRRAIGDRTAQPPFLRITRDSLQFNTASDHSLDVADFERQIADGQRQSANQQELPSAIRNLEAAIQLYRGGFLEGFSVGDSPPFEEWALFTRERLARQMSSALHHLALNHEQRGAYEQAQSYARRQIELEPWDEAAHQGLMRALALSGQRGAALAQYESCRRLLAEELGVEPAAETTRLYEQIRDGLLSRLRPEPSSRAQAEGAQPEGGAEERPASGVVAAAPSTPPPFLTSAPLQPSTPAPFVARERELAQLDAHLQAALAGQGRVVFVTGEAGSGKTSLIQEFIRCAQAVHADPATPDLPSASAPRSAAERVASAPRSAAERVASAPRSAAERVASAPRSAAERGLIAASGNCNAYTGIGDPYLPFREILELLSGDVEARWAAGAMTGDHARRLWHTLPLAAQALVEVGSDLIDTFVPRAALLERATAYAQWAGQADWLTRLDARGERKSTIVSSAPGPQQSDLFEQVTRVLQALAQRGPLLLVLDDLQWADLGSISLLFHLGRHLAGSCILIVGAYRPEEVAIGRDGERHPLDPVVNEFQRDFGDITVNLGQAEGRDLVEALLDSEPNRLGEAFREMLYRQTRGHPLFTIELLRGLQERGDLVQDPQGRWVEGPTLDWERLPARVEAVIGERIGRLAQPLQAALRVASVEGETFTAEVVARVQAADEREVVRQLSGELDRRHRLVRAQAIERLGLRRLSRYRFRNYLFQKYLYDDLDPVERSYLHEDVGNALEALYGEQARESADVAPIAAVAVQLAWHFEEAGIAEKAIRYLHQAGERAVQLSAYQEARAHLTRGLALLETLPGSGGQDRLERAQQELDLQLSLGTAWMGDIPGPEWQNAFIRARELCKQTGQTSQLSRVLGELSILHYVRADHQTACELAEEVLSLAQEAGDPLLVAVGHWCLGFTSFGVGKYTTAQAHLQQVISFYEPQQHHRRFLVLRGSDVGVSALAYDACCLWCLGYPEQAQKRSQEALALARELDHAFSLADVLCFAGCVSNKMRRDVPVLQEHAEELVRLSRGMGFLSFEGTGTCYWGEALAMQGRVQEGMALIREGLAIRQSIGAQCHLSGIMAALAEAQAKAGQPEEGLSTLDETLALVEQTDERLWEAELYRMKGELLSTQLMQDDQAEGCFQHAIQVARRQGAKSWELRATVSLARLWQAQGRTDEARQMLAEIYGWFSEGFDTRDLVEARSLLEELSSG